MPTLKAVILRHQKKADHTWNVKIRLTHKRQSAYIPTAIYVSKSQVTRNWEVKDTFLLIEIQDQIQRLRKAIIKRAAHLDKYSAKELAQTIKAPEHFELDMIDYMHQIHRELTTEGRSGTASLYKTVSGSLADFVKQSKAPIHEITPRFLSAYEKHLARRGLTPGGISLYMRTLRAAFNRARKEHNDEDRAEIPIPHYPFARYQIPSAGLPPKKALPAKTIQQIITAPTNPGTRAELARDVFAISFYLAGMNLADLYEAKPPQAGRINYERRKTRTRRKDRAAISLPIEPELQPLIIKYAPKKPGALFNFAERYASLDGFRKAVSKGMKQLSEAAQTPGLTSYHARHSWATIARNDCQISKDDIAVALNHADQTTTDIYLARSHDTIDRANRAVLDYLNSI